MVQKNALFLFQILIEEKCIRYFFCCIFLTLSTACFGFSDEYYKGYAQSILENFLPQEKIETIIKNKTLNIKIYSSPLDSQLEQQIKTRIEKGEYFTLITFTYLEQSYTKKYLTAVEENKEPVIELLPTGAIYNSPIADPRWPKFSVGYQGHFKKNYGRNIFNLSFGENLALWRKTSNPIVYEIGVQAGLFGLMDISKNPTTLVNSDYFVGLGASIVYHKNWQNIVQISHLSSHLGDELLISNEKYLSKRINLSYETLKWLSAYKFDNIRPYGGIGYMVHRDPSNLKPLTIEAGCDYLSKESFIFHTTRYIFGVHAHAWEDNNFKPSFNITTGLQLENSIWQSRYLKFLLDYSHGKSRHGQFYKKNEHYIGFMIALSN